MRRKRAAARIESRAVTGPCMAEYGPSMLGKKKIARTQSAASTASAHAIRPKVIGDLADCTGCQNCDEEQSTGKFHEGNSAFFFVSLRVLCGYCLCFAASSRCAFAMPKRAPPHQPCSRTCSSRSRLVRAAKIAARPRYPTAFRSSLRSTTGSRPTS
jgi:hypothetical protein